VDPDFVEQQVDAVLSLCAIIRSITAMPTTPRCAAARASSCSRSMPSGDCALAGATALQTKSGSVAAARHVLCAQRRAVFTPGKGAPFGSGFSGSAA
jgi:hypothetical protein